MAPFVSAKGAKTIFALSWPYGFPARFNDSGGCATRHAQTVLAVKPRNRLHCSATQKGLVKYEGF